MPKNKGHFTTLRGLAGGLLASIALSTAAPAAAQDTAEPLGLTQPLRISGLIQAVELGPVYVALRNYYPGDLEVQYGGIPLLFPEHWGGPIRPTDVAGHAETQALRNSVSHPNLRIIFTVAQGHYRILARRSSGIASLEDLRGKRIATMYPTSAGFYLHNVLAMTGISEDEVTILSQLRQVGISDPIINGDADAFTIWEPEMEIATRALGDDAIVFDADPGMWENYNLNTTAENLADPEKRAQIVEFIAAMILATDEVRRDPSLAITRASEMNGYDRELIEASYGHHSFPGQVADGLLDTLTAEEAWLAPQTGREPRSREELATLIDTSVVEEARALLRERGQLPDWVE
ncbi:ABC transporter substrate-binding protein [Parasphingopyxis marina]|uniref:ABC transporter substrate-binding protein n=1 Tax=Parasphingopyxis marina TaxID=2761622 RepID=A0A842HWJ0_9SPHN|nr:ABC transporter substrate-binding protein [Parasphingopyxis marina]MBC2776649.1 ABC transporter substrate-binding protein [Parasphingopyxis marina]